MRVVSLMETGIWEFFRELHQEVKALPQDFPKVMAVAVKRRVTAIL